MLMYKWKQESANHIENPDIVKLLELLLLHIIYCTASTLKLKKTVSETGTNFITRFVLRNFNNAFLDYGRRY